MKYLVKHGVSSYEAYQAVLLEDRTICETMHGFHEVRSALHRTGIVHGGTQSLPESLRAVHSLIQESEWRFNYWSSSEFLRKKRDLFVSPEKNRELLSIEQKIASLERERDLLLRGNIEKGEPSREETLYCGNVSNCFVWASHAALKALEGSATWSVDGTFKTRPRISARQMPWCQVCRSTYIFACSKGVLHRLPNL